MLTKLREARFAKLVALGLLCAACSSEGPTTTGAADAGDTASTDATTPTVDADTLVVELDILTYNVAGLPGPLSGSEPGEYTAQISPLLNAYSLVLVQEDFSYHDDLASEAEHEYQSTPGEQQGIGDSLGDGLNRFSTWPFANHQRVTWEECNGLFTDKNDCLTPKGFTVATHVMGGVEIDVYNLHMDAGKGDGDVMARADQAAQLVAAITAQSGGRPLIIAGDTNMREGLDDQVLADFMSSSGIVDACRSVSCLEPGRIDRVFMRGNDELEWTVLSWGVDPSFVTADGEDLSDHEAVGVTLALRRR